MLAASGWPLPSFACPWREIFLLFASVLLYRTLALFLALLIIMLLDFEVRTCSRLCAETGKALDPGEVYFSVLEVEETETVRRDYGAESWQGPPERSLGWWRSRVPVKNEKP